MAKKKKKNKKTKYNIEKVLRPYIKHALTLLIAGGALVGGTAYLGENTEPSPPATTTTSTSVDCGVVIGEAVDEQVASRERLRYKGLEQQQCKVNEAIDGIPLRE